MKQVVIRLMFIPTLVYNLLLSRLVPGRRWWDSVDEHVIVGALPFGRYVDDLVAQGVGAVVNTCAEYEGPVRAYERHGIEQLRMPTLDFTAPTLADVERAVAFIQEKRRNGQTVYVHCKAGRGRSATVVLCWLVAARGLAPADAQKVLLAVRPHVNRELWRRAVVTEFAARHA